MFLRKKIPTGKKQLASVPCQSPLTHWAPLPEALCSGIFGPLDTFHCLKLCNTNEVVRDAEEAAVHVGMFWFCSIFWSLWVGVDSNID